MAPRQLLIRSLRTRSPHGGDAHSRNDPEADLDTGARAAARQGDGVHGAGGRAGCRGGGHSVWIYRPGVPDSVSLPVVAGETGRFAALLRADGQRPMVACQAGSHA